MRAGGRRGWNATRAGKRTSAPSASISTATRIWSRRSWTSGAARPTPSSKFMRATGTCTSSATAGTKTRGAWSRSAGRECASRYARLLHSQESFVPTLGPKICHPSAWSIVCRYTAACATLDLDQSLPALGLLRLAAGDHQAAGLVHGERFRWKADLPFETPAATGAPHLPPERRGPGKRADLENLHSRPVIPLPR